MLSEANVRLDWRADAELRAKKNLYLRRSGDKRPLNSGSLNVDEFRPM
jgi:hypothetical protein